ncbi:MAG: hypothetical protein KGI99_20540 [Bradyrhizobium sp.]|nr:hypothetical protein [Bradyrhizobium sp.]
MPSCRPPWFDNQTAAQPRRCASSTWAADKIPFTITGKPVCSRQKATSSQDNSAFMAMAFPVTPEVFGTFPSARFGIGRPMSRVERSRLLVTVASTVRTIALYPAALARCSISMAKGRLAGIYG